MKPSHRSAILVATLFVAFVLQAACRGAAAPHQDPVAWWTFDETGGSTVVDRASGIADVVKGNSWRRAGVSGNGLKFDDFTTQVVRTAAKVPRVTAGLTVQAWIAVAAYPWNWAPIVSQERQPREGYFFGVGPRGEIGLSLAVRGTWQNCVSTDQSVEAWNATAGCFEHMQDPQCRYSQVRIIENTPARVVVHWRYAAVSSRDTFWKVDEKTGWGLWVDEYHTFYPDGTGLRRVTWRKKFLDREISEIQETLPLAQVGQGPDDVLEHDALKVANMDGETHTYSWPGDPKTESPVRPAHANIQVVNLRSKADPFIVFEPGNEMTVFMATMRSDGEHFAGCNHFPVSQIPSDGMRCVARDRVSHLGVNYNDPVWHESADGTVWAVWMTGTTEGPPDALLPLARSWLQPPELRLEGRAFAGDGYDRAQRAYVVRRADAAKSATLTGTFEASDQSPLVNACLIVKGWGDAPAAVRIGGRVLAERDGVRVGHLGTPNGADLLVWLTVRASKPVSVTIAPAR